MLPQDPLFLLKSGYSRFLSNYKIRFIVFNLCVILWIYWRIECRFFVYLFVWFCASVFSYIHRYSWAKTQVWLGHKIELGHESIKAFPQKPTAMRKLHIFAFFFLINSPKIYPFWDKGILYTTFAKPTFPKSFFIEVMHWNFVRNCCSSDSRVSVYNVQYLKLVHRTQSFMTYAMHKL